MPVQDPFGYLVGSARVTSRLCAGCLQRLAACRGLRDLLTTLARPVSGPTLWNFSNNKQKLETMFGFPRPCVALNNYGGLATSRAIYVTVTIFAGQTTAARHYNQPSGTLPQKVR